MNTQKIPILIAIIALIITLFILINVLTGKLGNCETWRIYLSIIGASIIFVLSALFIYKLWLKSK